VFSFTQSGKLQSLLHGLKYQNKTQVGIFLGREIGKTLQSSSYLDQIDLVLPIPLHPKKEHLRGYNQCDYIVEGITEVTRLPSSSKAIQRTVHTSSQTKRAKYDRWQNVSSIFETTAIQRIQGKNILLVDDVITTGSTLESCARELLNKGAKSVGIAVVASGI
jgi:ComF family protein